MSFEQLGLAKPLLKLLVLQNYEKAYPIQKEAIPAILSGKDVLGIAKTGSGKTASYVLPILTRYEGVIIPKNRHIQVLVLVPTRELAEQVKEVFENFSSVLEYSLKILAVYGGVSINPQMMALQGVNVLVATPGRLLDLVEKNALSLSEIKTLVLDEADKMLNLAFKDEMDRLFALMPQNRQNLLFSATFNQEVDSLHQVLLRKPIIIKIEEPKESIDTIQQLAYKVSESKKGPLLRYLIKTENMQQVLIFASSVFKVDSIVDKLIKNGIDAEGIHSKKSQSARLEVLRQFKNGKLQVLVATDLLSRGIDIDFLPCVINYELPRSPKDYIHRIGRTGRSENPGKAISFVSPDDEHHFKIIQKKMGKWVDQIDSDALNLHGF